MISLSHSTLKNSGNLENVSEDVCTQKLGWENAPENLSDELLSSELTIWGSFCLYIHPQWQKSPSVPADAIYHLAEVCCSFHGGKASIKYWHDWSSTLPLGIISQSCQKYWCRILTNNNERFLSNNNERWLSNQPPCPSLSSVWRSGNRNAEISTNLVTSSVQTLRMKYCFLTMMAIAPKMMTMANIVWTPFVLSLRILADWDSDCWARRDSGTSSDNGYPYLLWFSLWFMW
jgi:hypothetical protein